MLWKDISLSKTLVISLRLGPNLVWKRPDTTADVTQVCSTGLGLRQRGSS